MAVGELTADGRARVLADGHQMPVLGLGVWQVPAGPVCVNAVRWALDLGYRHIGTAQVYGNEESVGQALRESGVPRDEVHWPQGGGSARTRRFSTSPCRRATWPNSTRWIAPRAPARPVNVTSGRGPCGAPARSFRFGGLLERGQGDGNAVARGQGAVGDLGRGVAAEPVMEPGDAVREELPRLGDLRPPVDRGEGVAPPHPRAADHEGELTTPVGCHHLRAGLPGPFR